MLKNYSLNQSVQDYLHYCESVRGFSPCTLRNKRSILNRFALAFAKLPSRLESCDVADYVEALSERGLSSRSVNEHLRCLRCFFRFLLSRGLVPFNPVERIRPLPVTRRLPRFVSETHMDRALSPSQFSDDFSGILERTVVLTLYHTGLRASELLSLTVKSFSEKRHSLSVIGKYQRERILPLGQEICLQLKLYLGQRALLNPSASILFVTENGRPITYYRLLQICRRHLRLSGVHGRYTCHSIRHAFATALVNHGCNIHAVQLLLGHRHVFSTTLYTHVAPEPLIKSYDDAFRRTCLPIHENKPKPSF